MSHFRGPRAERVGRIAAKQIELDPIPFEVPRDFADTEATDEMPELAGWNWPMPNQPQAAPESGQESNDEQCH